MERQFDVLIEPETKDIRLAANTIEGFARPVVDLLKSQRSACYRPRAAKRAGGIGP